MNERKQNFILEGKPVTEEHITEVKSKPVHEIDREKELSIPLVKIDDLVEKILNSIKITPPEDICDGTVFAFKELTKRLENFEEKHKTASLVFLYRDILTVAYGIKNDWRTSKTVNIKKYIDTINNDTDNAAIYFNAENQKFAYTMAVKDLKISYGKNLSSDLPVELEFKDKIDIENINLFIKKCLARNVIK